MNSSRKVLIGQCQGLISVAKVQKGWKLVLWWGMAQGNGEWEHLPCPCVPSTETPPQCPAWRLLGPLPLCVKHKGLSSILLCLNRPRGSDAPGDSISRVPHLLPCGKYPQMQPSPFPSILPSSLPLLLIWVHTSRQVFHRQPVWGCLLTTCQGTYGFGQKIPSFSHRLLGPARQQELGTSSALGGWQDLQARGGGLRASGESGGTRKGWQKPWKMLAMWACAFVQRFPVPSWAQRNGCWFAAHPEQICRKQQRFFIVVVVFSFSLSIFFFCVNYPRHWNVLMRKSWLREGQEMKSRADFKNNAQFYCTANSQCVLEMKGKEKLHSI